MCTMGVVRRIDEHGRRDADELQATGCRGLTEPLGQHIACDRLGSPADERFDCRDREGGVEPLMSAVERKVLVLIGAGESAHGDLLTADGEALLCKGEVGPFEGDRGPMIGGRVTQHSRCRGILAGRHHRRPVFDDPRFHRGDVADGLAEPIGVIDVDRREDRDVSVSRVRRVPRTPPCRLRGRGRRSGHRRTRRTRAP
jgi:hypothetical protein